MKNNFYPVVSIVGTTSVGKTDCALAVAEELATKGVVGIDIISADSRQVYQGLEVISGADIPDGYQKKIDTTVSPFLYFEKSVIRLHGISILPLSADWSVSQFQDYATELIEKAALHKRAVLIVGGTGLYHEHLFNSDLRLHIPPNPAVRQKAKDLAVSELQNWLEKLDAEKLVAMNNSDRNNPRRLVRAIEIASEPVTATSENNTLQFPHRYIGLTAPLESILPKIEKRVVQRLAQGALEEVKALRETQDLAKQVKSTLGVELIEAYLDNALTYDELVANWTLEEKNYAKRQITWWKSKDSVRWFDVSQPGQKEASVAFCLQEFAND